jgi:putative sigma-54 modulation protein
VAPEPASAAEEEAEETHELTPADPIEFPMLEVDEALETLKANGRDFSIFSNRSTNRLNVLFKREDGTIGIIEA